MPNGETGLWKWTELPRFARFCRDISKRLGVSYEDEFDTIRWSIEEDVLRNPLSISHPDPRFEDEQRRYFRTSEAPAQVNVPPLIVIFRVARFPEFGEPGVIEGREVWIEEELRQIGYALEVDDAT